MNVPAPALYLIPVTLSDGQDPRAVLPEYNLQLIGGIRHFVVENLRSARRFLRRCHRDFDIDGSHFVELNEHNASRASDIAAMLQPLRDGHPVGLLSEAGCPAVADPGAELVAQAQREHLEVVPLVGPSSILMSLMASGLCGQSFAFNGYLPIDDAERTAAIRRLERSATDAHSTTQIFIEAPYRNNRMVRALASTLRPDTMLCVASDITGPRQSIITRTAAEWERASYDYDKVPTIFVIGKRLN